MRADIAGMLQWETLQNEILHGGHLDGRLCGVRHCGGDITMGDVAEMLQNETRVIGGDSQNKMATGNVTGGHCRMKHYRGHCNRRHSGMRPWLQNEMVMGDIAGGRCCNRRHHKARVRGRPHRMRWCLWGETVQNEVTIGDIERETLQWEIADGGGSIMTFAKGLEGDSGAF